MSKKIKVEIWSDIMCPFCYIGKRHFEAALNNFPDKENVEIEWKSFQLDPSIPESTAENIYEYLAKRKGFSVETSIKMHENVTKMAEAAGLHYHFDKAKVANSYKAHRLIQLAKTKGLGDVIEERFFLAYFTEGKDFGNEDVLKDLGKEIGLSLEEMNDALTNEEFSKRIRQDIAEGQQLGLTGVPFFVFNRKYGVSGAQPAAHFTDVLNAANKEE